MPTLEELYADSPTQWPGLHPATAQGLSSAMSYARQLGVIPQVTETVRPDNEQPEGGSSNSNHYARNGARAADLAWDGMQWGDANFNSVADHLESNGYSVIRDPHGTGPHIHFESQDRNPIDKMLFGTASAAPAPQAPITLESLYANKSQQPQKQTTLEELYASKQQPSAFTPERTQELLRNFNLAMGPMNQMAGVSNQLNKEAQQARDTMPIQQFQQSDMVAPKPNMEELGIPTDAKPFPKDETDSWPTKLAKNAWNMQANYFNTIDEDNPFKGATRIPDSDAGSGWVTKDGKFWTDEQAGNYMAEYAHKVVDPVAYPLAMFPPTAAIAAPFAGASVLDSMRTAYNEQGMVGVGKAILSPVTGLYEKAANPSKFIEDLQNAPAETLFNTALELGVVAMVGKGVYNMTRPQATVIEGAKGEFRPSETGPVTRQYTAEDLTPASRAELMDAIKVQLEKIKQQKWDEQTLSNSVPESFNMKTNRPIVDTVERVPGEFIDPTKATPGSIVLPEASLGITPRSKTTILPEYPPNAETVFARSRTGAEALPPTEIIRGKFSDGNTGKLYDVTSFTDKLNKIAAIRKTKEETLSRVKKAEMDNLRKDVSEEIRQLLYPELKSVDTAKAEKAQRSIDVINHFVELQESNKKKKSNLSEFPEKESNIPEELMAEYEKFLQSEVDRIGGDWTRDRVQSTIGKIQEKFPVNKVTAERDFTNVSETGKLYDATSMLEKIGEKIPFLRSAQQAEKGSVRAGISTASDASKSPIERGIEAGKQLFTDYVDKYSPIQNEVARFEKETGMKIKPEESPYDRAQVAHTSSARAEMMVKGKTPEEISALKDHYPLIHDVTMAQVEGSLPKGSLSHELKAQGWTNWTDAFDGFLGAKRQLELQKNNPEYIGSMDATKAQAFIEKAPSEFHKAADMFYKYGDNLLEIAQKAGIVSPEVIAAIRAKYKNYAPMARDFSDVSAMDGFFGDGRGMVNVGGVLQRIKEGSERAVVSPMESMIKNTFMVLSKVERNNVGKAIADLSEVSDGQFFAKKTNEPASPEKSIFTVREKGETVNYQTTPEIYRALTGMNEEAAGQLVKILSYPTGWLRAGATLDPGFFFKNTSRDTIGAGVYSKYGFVPVYDSIMGMADIIGNKKLYAQYRASGAPLSVITGMDRNSLAQTIKSLNGKELWTNYNPIELLRAMTGFFENSTRIREFQKAQQAGEGNVGQTRAAQEVTLNFSQSGAKGSTPNKLVAFFNAQVQGVNKLIQEHKTNPVRTAGKAALYITLPSVGLWLMNHDDIRYQEIPQTQRDLFWIVPTGEKITKEKFDSMIKSGMTKQQILDQAGPMIRIPKPFELGLIYGSLPERFLDYAMTKDPKGMKKWASSALKGLVPNFMPTVATPVVEGITNHSFFRDRDLVPRRNEKLPPKLQSDTNTSETAKWLGKKAEVFTEGGVSPAKIDNALSGYFGGLGRSVIDSAELAAQVREGRASKLLTEQPVLRSFFVTPFKGAESVQEFYSQYQRQASLLEELKKTHKKPAEFDGALYARLNEANTAIQGVNKAQRDIEANEKLPPDEKRKKLDALNLIVLQISRKALKK